MSKQKSSSSQSAQMARAAGPKEEAFDKDAPPTPASDCFESELGCTGGSRRGAPSSAASKDEQRSRNDAKAQRRLPEKPPTDPKWRTDGGIQVPKGSEPICRGFVRCNSDAKSEAESIHIKEDRIRKQNIYERPALCGRTTCLIGTGENSVVRRNAQLGGHIVGAAPVKEEGAVPVRQFISMYNFKSTAGQKPSSTSDGDSESNSSVAVPSPSAATSPISSRSELQNQQQTFGQAAVKKVANLPSELSDGSRQMSATSSIKGTGESSKTRVNEGTAAATAAVSKAEEEAVLELCSSLHSFHLANAMPESTGGDRDCTLCAEESFSELPTSIEPFRVASSCSADADADTDSTDSIEQLLREQILKARAAAPTTANRNRSLICNGENNMVRLRNARVGKHIASAASEKAGAVPTRPFVSLFDFKSTAREKCSTAGGSDDDSSNAKTLHLTAVPPHSKQQNKKSGQAAGSNQTTTSSHLRGKAESSTTPNVRVSDRSAAITTAEEGEVLAI